MLTTAPHPLDPLTQTELTTASTIIKSCPQAVALTSFIFNSVSLNEPDKYAVLACTDGGDAPAREAIAVLIDKTGDVYEVVVDVVKACVVSWTNIPNAQPPLTPEDCITAEKIVQSSDKVKALLEERGITDIKMVVADPWSYGHHGEKDLTGKRLVQTFMYLKKDHMNENQYARPLDFVPVIDIVSQTVIKIDFQRGKPKDFTPHLQSHNYDSHFMSEKYRSGLKPLDVIQPEGASFEVEGNGVEWQKWGFRIGFNYREGLVLYNVTYNDEGKVRPILYRAALAEMVVPYADPTPPFHRKSAFDVGDYGLGFCANSLTLGCDCLGTIKYFDAVMNNHDGTPFVLKNAICMHEEDAGVLWKHVEYRTGHAEVRRSRKLVISFIATVVNYEYAFYWHLYQDGTIQYEIKATGELSTTIIEPNTIPKYGTLVAPQINAQYHQHLFNMRIDPMIDGINNTVEEVDIVPVDMDDSNPYGNAFKPVSTPLKTELQAKRTANPLAGRYWKIVNKESINPYSLTPVAFKLVSNGTPLLFARDGSFIAKRAEFAKHHLWVTPYARYERYPAGEYINQSAGGQGLPLWTSGDRCVEGTDIVVWHTFGVTHIPRVEDFPIMPVDSSGFMLKPLNFFTANPSVDVPPSVPKKDDKKADCCSATMTEAVAGLAV